jgi:predicted GIY-YIG superfamily endonuclease
LTGVAGWIVSPSARNDGHGEALCRHCEERSDEAIHPRNSAEKDKHTLSREPCVYILANRRQGTLYTGVTSNLAERVFQHREGLTPGFSSRYACNRLVFYERYERMDEAIAREKQIKGGSRARKIALIEAVNPDWKDLYRSLA